MIWLEWTFSARSATHFSLPSHVNVSTSPSFLCFRAWYTCSTSWYLCCTPWNISSTPANYFPSSQTILFLLTEDTFLPHRRYFSYPQTKLYRFARFPRGLCKSDNFRMFFNTEDTENTEMICNFSILCQSETLWPLCPLCWRTPESNTNLQQSKLI